MQDAFLPVQYAGPKFVASTITGEQNKRNTKQKASCPSEQIAGVVHSGRESIKQTLLKTWHADQQQLLCMDTELQSCTKCWTSRPGGCSVSRGDRRGVKCTAIRSWASLAMIHLSDCASRVREHTRDYNHWAGTPVGAAASAAPGSQTELSTTPTSQVRCVEMNPRQRSKAHTSRTSKVCYIRRYRADKHFNLLN